VPLVWIVFAVLGVIGLSALLLIAFALFSPLIFTVDSGNGQVRVRWFAALEYRRPLPGSEGKPNLSIAGKSVKIPARRPKRKGVRTASSLGRRRNPAAVPRFLRNCLREPAIRRILAKRFRRLGKGIVRAVDLTRWRVDLSLPDPAWNGMLMGWLAQCHDGQGSGVRVNFTGENGLFLEFRVYPYRVAKVVLLFSAGLPYRALWREWRAASAMVSR